MKKEKIKKILLLSLSNLGDIVLTTPVLVKLNENFPNAEIDVFTGFTGEEIFREHPAVKHINVYQRRQGLLKRIPQVIKLRREKYDVVVDLKNSLIPYLAGARYHTTLPVFKLSSEVKHKRDEHLSKLLSLGINPLYGASFFIPIKKKDKIYIDGVVASLSNDNFVIVSPGSKSHIKKWGAEKYASLCDRVIEEFGCSVILVGDKDDGPVIGKVIAQMKNMPVNLCSKTSIGALAELMQRSSLVITNDSAPLHIASAMNAPTLAIFGPTDEKKYGPLAERSIVIKPVVECRPCNKGSCGERMKNGCISTITVDEVFGAAKKILDMSF